MIRSDAATGAVPGTPFGVGTIISVDANTVNASPTGTPAAPAKALTLTVAACLPDLAVRADAEKLRQILVNLLRTAVKFTDRGGRVELACAEAGGRVEVVVRDTGIGIAAGQLERIFDPFVQVRSDVTRSGGARSS